MTPRGVDRCARLHARAREARLGIPRGSCRTTSGSRATPATTSRASPGIGDKTAADLLQRFGSLDGIYENLDEVAGAEAAAVADRAGGRGARVARSSARSRRNLPELAELDLAAVVSTAARPLDAQGAVPPLGVPRPAARAWTSWRSACRRSRATRAGTAVAWRQVTPDELRRAALAGAPESRASRPTGSAPPWRWTDEVLVVDGRRRDALARRARRRRRSSPTTSRRCRTRCLRGRPGAGLRHLPGGLPDRPGPLGLHARRPAGRGRASSSRCRPRRRRRRWSAAASAPLRAARVAGAAPRGARPDAPAGRHRAAARRRAGGDGGRRRARRPGRAGRASPRAWRRGARSSRSGRTSSRAAAVRDRLAQAARRGAVRAARPARRPQGQDGLLDRPARAREDPRPAPDRGRGRALARADEAALHVPDRAAGWPSPTTGASTRRSRRPRPPPAGSRSTNPNLQNIPVRTPLGREIRARVRRGRRARGCCRPTTRRSSCASSPTCPARRCCARPSSAARTCTAHGRRGARQAGRRADARRARPRQGGQLRDHLRHLVVRPVRAARHRPRDEAQTLHRHLPRPLPARAASSSSARSRGRGARLRR